MKRKSTRRDFLKGKAAAEAMADRAQEGLVSGGTGGALLGPTNEAYLVRVSREAMACEFEVCLRAGQYPHGTEAALDALELLETLEAQMSVFRPKGTISEVNRSAAEAPVTLEPWLFELLQQADRLSEETDGALDLTAGRLSDLWGFSRRAEAVPTQAQIAEARQYVGRHLVELDPARSTIRLKKPGVKLNLGSIGKGYALDRVAEELEAQGIVDFLIQGGQSSVLARGHSMGGTENAAKDSKGGWTVGVAHPLRPGQRLAEIRLNDRALGTSGSARQFFRYQGRRFSHLLDPRTGWPAEGVLSVTVLAPTAATADGLATALFVSGPERSEAFCRDHADLGILWVCPGTARGRVEIHATGIPEADLRILGDR